MRIIFMGTPDFAIPTLSALAASSHEIAAVYSQPPRPAGRGQKETPTAIHQFAAHLELPVFTPVSLKSPEEQEKFRALNADVAVVVAYGLLLPQAILEGTKFGCINIHPSALPRWRGAAPLQRTIMAGDTTTDICIMQMDAGLDTGPVLLRKSYPITDGTTAGELHDRLAQAAPGLLLHALAQLPMKGTPQAQEGVTYAQKISKEEAQLDFTQPAKIVRQKILGLSPHPGAWFEHQGERIKVFNASLSEKNDFPLPCNPGTLYPTELQRPGGKRLPVAEFLAGFKPSKPSPLEGEGWVGGVVRV